MKCFECKSHYVSGQDRSLHFDTCGEYIDKGIELLNKKQLQTKALSKHLNGRFEEDCPLVCFQKTLSGPDVHLVQAAKAAKTLVLSNQNQNHIQFVLEEHFQTKFDLV